MKTKEKSLLPVSCTIILLQITQTLPTALLLTIYQNKQKETWKLNLNFVQPGVSSLFKLC